LKKHIHIVSFDIPFPADYGGVIDIYHKIRWLHKLGLNITLHCFQYGRSEAPELNSICKKVHYYRRSKYKNPFIGDIPYIVLTRNNEDLLDNLCKDNSPILFEGLHSTFFLQHEKLKGRIKLVRNHNIEHDYYKNLELVESNYFKKYFFRNESDNLKKYERIIRSCTNVLAISPSDHHYLNKKYHNSILLPAFHANDDISIKTGNGKFVLYHGNLVVGENHFAAMYLVNEVFSRIRIPCVIAGSHPSDELVRACAKHSHIKLVDDWSHEQIMDAVHNAHINVLPTFQGTGIKLKLLNSLFGGRFCVVNPTMVNNTGLEHACLISDNAADMIRHIEHCWEKPFTDKNVEERKKVLNRSLFNNRKNAVELVKTLGFLLESTK
jgi:hypothetical protein